MTIAIIGAGIAGLAAATTLRDAGVAVRVFDKGRGPGGRLSTRRAETSAGEARFDHGAPYFEASTVPFRAQVADWKKAGVVADWDGPMISFGAQGETEAQPASKRLVGTPGMNSLIRALADGVEVIWNQRVTALTRQSGQWQLTFEDGHDESGFSAVICAVPLEQARPFYAQAYSGPSLLPDMVSAPCWALLLAFDQSLDLPWTSATVTTGPLAKIINEASKPGRSGPPTLVAHATRTWSEANLERGKDEVAADLLAAVRTWIGGPAPIHCSAHRWRYSQIATPVSEQVIWDDDLKLGFCGDWCQGPTLEDGWLSGRRLADRLGRTV